MQGRAALCGNGLLAYPEAFGRYGGAAQLAAIMPHATSVARLAAASLARGESVAPHEAQPLYLRDKVALTTRERSAAASGNGASA